MIDTTKLTRDHAALTVESLSKGFLGVQALAGVSFQIGLGEVHALLGENGSGKSTCIKILSGYYRPDAGSVHIGSNLLSFGHPEYSRRAGGRFVHQDLGLVDDISVLDNMALGSSFPTRYGTIRRKQARHSAAKALERVQLDLDLRRPVSELSLAERTGVAVARALQDDAQAPAQLLVLDEPTATLPDAEVARLMDIIRAVAASGIGVLYVTHRLQEIFEIAQTVTVLREGRVAATAAAAALTRTELLQYLLGSKFAELTQPAAERPVQGGRRLLAVRNLRAENIADVSFDVYQGEIVGIAGITGSGRENLCNGIFGAVERAGGEVRVDETRLVANAPAQSIRSGLVLLPAERKRYGAMMDMSARENITIPNIRPFFRRLFLSRRAEAKEALKWFDRLDVRPQGAVEQNLAVFSGGNQQKIILAKWLRLGPKLLLADEPTQGVDIGAKAALHLELQKVAAGGAAVVISSTDTEELVALCHRVLVLRGGRLGAELTGADVREPKIVEECLQSVERD